MIRLLLVDDSPLMRRLLTEMFEDAGDFEIEVARNGVEALEKLEEFRPDVITLDVHMPDMDGLAVLDQIMVQRPCPVVMVSSLTADGADETLEAMALGAVDFVSKPRGAVSLEIDAVADTLIEKVRSAAAVRMSRVTRLRERVQAKAKSAVRPAKPRAAAPKSATRPDAVKPLPAGSHVVLVGCSTGGPPALDALLGALPADFPWPIVIAQHMPASFTAPLARRLDRLCALSVREVDVATALSPGTAYIGKGDADVVLSRRGGQTVVMPAPSSPDHLWHPSVDRLVDSALKYLAPESLIGVLMTGMGADGANAMTELKRRGGHTIAESAATAVVWGMPGALVAGGGASSVQPLDDIAGELLSLAGR
ncbi:MAG: chemotaxis response regulator protein-glutamate methylesterase [Pseudomonadota bacterium]